MRRRRFPLFISQDGAPPHMATRDVACSHPAQVALRSCASAAWQPQGVETEEHIVRVMHGSNHGGLALGACAFALAIQPRCCEPCLLRCCGMQAAHLPMHLYML